MKHKGVGLTKDIRHEGVRRVENLGKHHLLVGAGSALQLLLDESRAVLVLGSRAFTLHFRFI